MQRVLLPVLFLLAAAAAWPHSGGLDANGGHWNRKTGTYHYHRAPSVAVPQRPAAVSQPRIYTPRQPPPASRPRVYVAPSQTGVPAAGVARGSAAALFAATAGHTAQVAVYFSPNGGCTDAIVQNLAAAKREVLVQAYSFTSAAIAAALRDAHRRGVKVAALLDKSNQTDKYSSATFLHNAGIPTYIDRAHAIAHNKILVIDGETVITGSFNFSRAAEENNAENLVVIKGSPEVAKAYGENFAAHLSHAQPYRKGESLESVGKSRAAP